MHLAYHGISLLEFLFNYLEFLRVSKGILRADNFLELVTQTSTLFHVKLDFNLNFLLASTSYVALQCLDLVQTALIFSLKILDLALQIDDQVGICFEGATQTVTLEFWRRLRQSIVSFLLQD